MAKNKVSIIIPSFNSQKYIEKCLRSLLHQETKIPYEIIVVESGGDSTAEIVKKYPVKLIQPKGQTLPGEGRNIGVTSATGEILAFIDSDCIAHKYWLDTAIKNLDKYSIVGGSVGNANPGWISTTDYILTFNEFLPSMPGKETTFMPTCNFFCKRSIFEEMGGFRNDLAAGEDTMFNYEAAKKYKLLFDPKIKIKHHNRETFNSFCRHHLNFGKHSALVRKQVKLPGHIFANYPFLALLVPFVRTLRISLRMVKWNRRMIPDFILSLPLIFLGVVIWSFGFIKYSLKKQ
jgi:glycosyltransferase involved in cell wall biosynthesis